MSAARPGELDTMLAAIRACRVCVERPLGKKLPHEPRPVLRASATARLAVCSQAPGHQGARLGHAVHRRIRRPLAGVDGSHAAKNSTTKRASPSCRWGSAFRARMRTAQTCRRGRNARRCGIASCSPLCRRSSSCWRSAPTRKPSISARRQERPCKRPCSAGVCTCIRKSPSARAAVAPPILAQQ